MGRISPGPRSTHLEIQTSIKGMASWGSLPYYERMNRGFQVLRARQLLARSIDGKHKHILAPWVSMTRMHGMRAQETIETIEAHPPIHQAAKTKRLLFSHPFPNVRHTAAKPKIPLAAHQSGITWASDPFFAISNLARDIIPRGHRHAKRNKMDL